jgi:integrase
MRVSEIMKLRLRHIKNNKFLTIYKTKTDNGKRNIPFYILLPVPVSRALIAYYQERKKQVKSLDELLFVQKNGNKWNPSQISRDTAKLFSAIGVRNFHFHHLRHTAANIYLFRVIETYYPELIPRYAPILKHELFNEDSLKNLKIMLHGMGGHRVGDDAVDFALHILAHLMGHGGPQVTIQEYVHCSDVLFYYMSRHHDDIKIPFSIGQMMDFLQCTHRQLPYMAYSQSIDGDIDLGQLLNYQRNFVLKPDLS